MKLKLIASAFLIATSAIKAQQVNYSKVFADAEQQTQVLLKEIPAAQDGKADMVSPRTVENNKLKMVSSRDWTSGFFPGILWYLFEYTGNTNWKGEAEKYTALIEREKTNAGTHDMGFKIYCSFGNGYRLTSNPHYKDVIIESAKTLTTRFNATAGVIKSWDHRREWQFPVIIDNMMNLELLYEAAKLTGDTTYSHIANTHALTTMKNHFRSDKSSYHVVDYDTLTGKVNQKATHQGYSDESSWARGQAWGLYGFTMCYRETKNKAFLQQADHIAEYILTNPTLPKDYIPYWDFSVPNITTEPRDVSAAAIMASAFYELSTYSKNKKQYLGAADKILHSLTQYYRSVVGENKGFLLLHSTGHKPAKSEIDVPITYADYYYLEALLRSKNLVRK